MHVVFQLSRPLSFSPFAFTALQKSNLQKNYRIFFLNELSALVIFYVSHQHKRDVNSQKFILTMQKKEIG